MGEQLTPVYDNTEALVAAVTHRSATVAQKEPLYLRHQLDRALDGLGAWRPRAKASLNESIKEAETYIDVTEKRLQYLRDICAHAQILRGAVQSYEAITRRSDGATATVADHDAERDFTFATENETTSMAAFELRGLLRARRLGNLNGAFQDFVALQGQAEHLFCVRGQARALRHQSEILARQSAGEKRRLLIDARSNLNAANKLFEDGRTLGDADLFERAQNREAYGIVQAALAAIAGTSNRRAGRAYNDALNYYRQSNLTTDADLNRIRERLGFLTEVPPHPASWISVKTTSIWGAD